MEFDPTSEYGKQQLERLRRWARENPEAFKAEAARWADSMNVDPALRERFIEDALKEATGGSSL